MKTLLRICFLALYPCFHSMAQPTTPALNLMTWNIRFDNPEDGPNRWDRRKAYVAETLRFYDVHLCGMQEALKNQVDDLLAMLPHFAYVGVGRDDGREAGEFSPIFFDTLRLSALQSGTFWLSPTPQRPSRGWDAALPRIATWAQFRDKRTGLLFFVFNTHFDHVGQQARLQSAQLLLEKIGELAGSIPTFIMGDLNARPQAPPVQWLLEHLTDCKAVSQLPHFGPHATFNGFGSSEVEDVQIDYIFCTSPTVQVLRHATLSHTWAGRFASDHHAVLAVVSLLAQ